MIVALLNQKGAVGKTTLALHLAGAWAAQGKRVVVIDADLQDSALDWSARPSNRRFASRPGDPDAWIRAREPSATAQNASDLFTARLTVDVTPELRARIKITAFQRGQTVADMQRDLFAREFLATDGGQT